MKIERIELREVSLRLRERFETGGGARQDRRIVLLRLVADGIDGWAECVAGEVPTYSAETTDTAWHVLTRHILPTVAGLSIDAPEGVLDPIAWIRGHGMAKATVEMAAWDLAAKAEGVALSKKLGGTRAGVSAGVSIGLQATDAELHEKVAAYLADGYARIKVKIQPGRDIEMLEKLRRRFPDAPLMADANAAYTLADAPLFETMDALGLLMVEQPLAAADLVGHARLQARIATPICLDESIESEDDLATALELGSCRVVNVKPGRVGGHAAAKGIHDRMRARGLPVWCGGMLESGIGRAHNVALASLEGFSLPGDLSASRRYWERDIVTPEFSVENGEIRVPRGFGIGVTPDLDRIEAATVRVATFG